MLSVNYDRLPREIVPKQSKSGENYFAVNGNLDLRDSGIYYHLPENLTVRGSFYQNGQANIPERLTVWRHLNLKGDAVLPDDLYVIGNLNVTGNKFPVVVPPTAKIRGQIHADGKVLDLRPSWDDRVYEKISRQRHCTEALAFSGQLLSVCEHIPKIAAHISDLSPTTAAVTTSIAATAGVLYAYGVAKEICRPPSRVIANTPLLHQSLTQFLAPIVGYWTAPLLAPLTVVQGLNKAARDVVRLVRGKPQPTTSTSLQL